MSDYKTGLSYRKFNVLSFAKEACIQGCPFVRGREGKNSNIHRGVARMLPENRWAIVGIVWIVCSGVQWDGCSVIISFNEDFVWCASGYRPVRLCLAVTRTYR